MRFVDALGFTSAQLADATTACFEGYVVPLRFDAASFERRFHTESLDRQASLVAVDGESVAGILLVARRGWTSRVAAMAVAPAYRGAGVGKRLLRRAIDDARERGDGRIVLEVIETNEPAVALYRSAGFAATRRLVGYGGRPGGGDEAPVDPLDPLDPAVVGALAATDGDDDLPWQLQTSTLARHAFPAQAVHFEKRAFATYLETRQGIALLGLVVRRADRRQGLGSRLIRSLASIGETRSVRIPQIVPEACAPEFFASLHLERDPLTQWEMSLTLS